MSEDKNLNGVQDDEELVNLGEAKGSGTSEAVSESLSSEVAESSEAPAEEESDTEEVSNEQAEEVVPLAVLSITFADEEVITFEVEDDLQLELRALCDMKGERPVSFEVVGDISPQELRLIQNSIK